MCLFFASYPPRAPVLNLLLNLGTNSDRTFENEILENTQHCEVWAYDYSARSYGYVPKGYSSRTHFQPFGLAGSDAHEPSDNPKTYTLQSLMRLNGHKHIDILKIDVEGWEFEILSSIAKAYLASDLPLPFGQLQIEIHAWNKKFPEFLNWWETLEAAGLRPFATAPNLVYQNYNKLSNSDLAEYSFINVKGDNIFIVDAPLPAEERNRVLDGAGRQ